MKKKFIVAGNYGATNIGDETILDGVIYALNEAFKDVDITVLSANPKKTSKLHNVKSLKMGAAGVRSFFWGVLSLSLFKTFRSIRKADYFILGGGGLFTDEKIKAVFVWYMQFLYARIFRTPVICIGQSVGPLTTRFGKWATKQVFSKSILNIVRDVNSRDVLNGLGVFDVYVLTDIAFIKDRPFANSDEDHSYIVMSIRPWITDDVNKYKDLAKFIDTIFKKYKYKTVFVPFQSLKDDDLEVMKKIYSYLKNKDAVSFFEFNDDINEVLYLMAKADFVVGMRLHSLIFSTLSNTPFIALSYSDKVKSFVESVELDDYLIDWNDFDFKKIMMLWKSIYNNRDKVIENVTQSLIFNRGIAKKYIEILKQIDVC